MAGTTMRPPFVIWANYRAGADGGMTVLFHAERDWPAAAQHGRSLMNYHSSIVPFLRHTIARVFVLLLASCAGGFASVEYAVFQLFPPPGYDSLTPRDINDAGQ